MLKLSRSALVLLLAAVTAACGGDGNTPTGPGPTGSAPFQVVDIRIGTGTEATNGRTVTVAYVGWLYSSTAAENKGSQFQSGVFSFTLGGGQPQPIEGWRRGILGMRVGGQRRLVIPPELAYGSSTPDPVSIPPNATLVFDVELRNAQ